MSERDHNPLIVYGLVALGAYLLWKAITNVKNPLAPAGQAAGGWLYELFNPSPAPVAMQGGTIPPGSVTTPGQATYTVIFEDGSRHAVDASTVASDGSFNYQGLSYTLVIGQGANYALLNQ